MKHLLTLALLVLTLLSAQATIAITPLPDCLCEGGSSPQQAFELTAEGTAGPFTFRWAGPAGYASAEQNPTDITTAGDYTVEVTNSFGCTFQYDITIPACPAPSFSGDKTETCPGQATGSITVMAAGGTPPYTYSWSNGADTPDIYDLAEGIYYLTVGDSRGCTETGFFKILSSGLGFSVNVAITHPACASSSDGALQLAMQPAGAYTIAWSNGGDGESVSGLAAGSYTATVTDASSCSVEKTMVLLAPAPIEVFAEQVYPTTCPEAADGRAVLSVDGGTLPYDIAWSTGATGPEATHLAAGPNAVTVTDGNGCMASTVVNIPSGEGLAVDATVTPMNCSNGPDGGISLNVGGATGQLSYSWSGPAGPITVNSAQLNGLGTGNYCATVTDGMGCAGSGCWVVESSVDWPYIQKVKVFVVDASQDILIYSAEWIETAGGCLSYIVDEAVFITPAAFNAISADKPLRFEVQANVGVNLSLNPLMTTNGTIISDIQSVGSNNNTFWTFLVIGLTSEMINTDGFIYQQLEFSGYAQDDPTQEILALGMNGTEACFPLPGLTSNCIWEPSATQGNDVAHVLEMPCLDVAVISIPENLLIKVKIPGAEEPYTEFSFHWVSPNLPGFSSNEFFIRPLEGGIYCVEVVSPSGCTFSKCITFCTDLDAYTYETEPSCPGQDNGQVCLELENAFSSGDIQAQWAFDSGLSYQNAMCINGLSPGSYTGTLFLEYLGCEAITSAFSFTVPEHASSPLTVSSFSLSPDCPATLEGEGTNCLEVTGGAPPYSYEWSDNSTGDCLQNVSSGQVFSVTVSDQCSAEAVAGPILPESYPNLSILLESQEGAVCTSENGAISFVVSGGRSPYTYEWQASTGQSGEGGSEGLISLNDLSGGDYSLTISDGCTPELIRDFEIEILDGPAFSVTEVEIGHICSEGGFGSIEVYTEGENLSGPFDYSWSNGAAVSNPNHLPAGQYSLTLSNIYGCVLVLTEWPAGVPIAIENGAISEEIIEYTNIPTCGEDYISIQNDPLELGATHIGGNTASGEINIIINDNSTGPFQYSWSNGGNASVASRLEEGSYTVTLTNRFGCSVEKEFVIESKLFDLDMDISNIVPGCFYVTVEDGFNMSLDFSFTDNSEIGPQPPYSVDVYNIYYGVLRDHWETNNTTFESSITNMLPENHQILVTNAQGCTYERNLKFGSSSALPRPEIHDLDYAGESIDNQGNPQQDGFIKIQIYGDGTPPYQITWYDDRSRFNEWPMIESPGNIINDDNVTEIYGLSAGTYSVVVTDQNGCSSFTDIILENCISGSNDITINHNSLDISHIYENQNGSIYNVTIEGNYRDHTWFGPNGFAETSLELSGLEEAGEYCLVVHDFNHCRTEYCVEIIDDCPDMRLLLNHVNSCRTNGNGISKLIFEGIELSNGGSTENVYLEWDSDWSSTLQMGHVTVTSSSNNPNQFLIDEVISPITESIPGDPLYYGGRIRVTATIDNGCRIEGYADFGEELLLMPRYFEYSHYSDIYPSQTEFISSFFAPLVDEITFVPACGCLFDGVNSLCNHNWHDRYDERLWFEPRQNGNWNPNASNICQLGGELHIGDQDYRITIPPNAVGFYVEEEDNCGCIFPPEFLADFPPVSYFLSDFEWYTTLLQEHVYLDVCAPANENDVTINVNATPNNNDLNLSEELQQLCDDCGRCRLELDLHTEQYCQYILTCLTTGEPITDENGIPYTAVVGSLCKCLRYPNCRVIEYCAAAPGCNLGQVIAVIDYEENCGDPLSPLADILSCDGIGRGCLCNIVETGNKGIENLQEFLPDNENSSYVIQEGKNQAFHVEVGPIPFKDKLDIVIYNPNKGKVYFTIFDFQGRPILEKEVSLYKTRNQVGIQFLESLNNGIYFLKAQDEQGYEDVHKLIRME